MELKDGFLGRLHGQPYYRVRKSEAYVEIPPALLITDECGDSWSVGFEYFMHGDRIHYNVIHNDQDTGEYAEKIVYQNGRVRIFGWYGWKTYNGKTFI